VLLPYAKKSIDLIKDTDMVMSSFAEQLKGRLLLGASLTIGESILPRWLGPFGKEFPNIGISMKVMNTTHLIEEIENHQLNFAIIEAPIEHPDMNIEAVMEDELVLVVPSDHPLIAIERLRLEDVLQYPFVLREQGSGTRQVMEDKLIANGFDPLQLKIVMELGSTGAIKSAVEAGLGISFLSISSVKHELALGLVKTLPIDNITFTRQFYSVYLKSSLLPISAVTFLNFLRERDLSQWL